MDSSVMNAVLYQFDHEVWEGFRFWDLVMPLFLFMTGVSMPFSFSKYERVESRWFIYKKVLRRFAILFLLGMVVQGNLLGLDLKYIRFKHVAGYRCRIFDRCAHSIELFFKRADGYDVSVVVGLLVPYDIFWRFHTGREFCREGGSFCLGPIP